MQLFNKTVVVTGAAGSLGQAVCKIAKQQGARVLGLDVVGTESFEYTDSYHQVDLLNREETKTLFVDLDGFDALVNVAGGFSMGGQISEGNEQEWNLMFDMNVKTMRNAVIAAVPTLKKQDKSAIVNVGAIGAVAGSGMMGAYCAAKSTVMRLTESLSEELKGEGVNVNAVLPGIIDTPANRHAMPETDTSQWVSPDGLAQVICFMMSDSASAVHGALIPVKGLG